MTSSLVQKRLPHTLVRPSYQTKKPKCSPFHVGLVRPWSSCWTNLPHAPSLSQLPRVPLRSIQLDQGLTSPTDRKSTRLNSSHQIISYAVFCLKKKKNTTDHT